MPTAFVQRVLRENRPLFAMMHGFNFHPALHIHPRRFADDVSAGVVELLTNSRRGEIRLSQWASAKWQLPAEPFWDFADPRRRLALMKPDQLDALLRYAGAAAHSHVISRAIDRNTQTRFREALGESAYHFAVKRAPLLSRGLPESLTQRIDTNTDLQAALEDTGYRCVRLCLTDIPPQLQTRLNLKRPADATPESDTSASDQQRERVWMMLKRILLTEVAPELKSCFN